MSERARLTPGGKVHIAADRGGLICVTRVGDRTLLPTDDPLSCGNCLRMAPPEAPAPTVAPELPAPEIAPEVEVTPNAAPLRWTTRDWNGRPLHRCLRCGFRHVDEGWMAWHVGRPCNITVR